MFFLFYFLVNIGFPLYLIGFLLFLLIVKEIINVCDIESTDQKNLSLIGNKTCVFVVPGTLTLT